MTFRWQVDAPGLGGPSSAVGVRLTDLGSESLSRTFSALRRWAMSFGFLLFLSAAASANVLGQYGHPAPPPHASQPAPHNPGSGGAIHPNSHPNPQPKPPGQQHLDEWLQRNRGLTTQQQMERLQHEPGFNQLSPAQQQRARERLNQVQHMPPDQQQRWLERVENMERLPPQQQQAVRWSASRLGQLPPNRQQAVKDAIRTLRDVPPGQRQSELLSPRYAGQLNPEERYIAGSLLAVEPYHPSAQSPR